MATLGSDLWYRKKKKKTLGVDGKTLWNYFNIIHIQLARNCLIIVKKDVTIMRKSACKGHPDYTLSWHLDRRGGNINYCQYHRERPQSWSCQVSNMLQARSWVSCMAQLDSYHNRVLEKHYFVPEKYFLSELNVFFFQYIFQYCNF